MTSSTKRRLTCYGLNCVPCMRDVEILLPNTSGNDLIWKQAMKLDLSPIHLVSLHQGNWDTETHTQRTPCVKMEADFGVVHLCVEECKGLPLSPAPGRQVWNSSQEEPTLLTPGFGHLPLDLWENRTRLWYFVSAVLGNEST